MIVDFTDVIRDAMTLPSWRSFELDGVWLPGRLTHWLMDALRFETIVQENKAG